MYELFATAEAEGGGVYNLRLRHLGAGISSYANIRPDDLIWFKLEQDRIAVKVLEVWHDFQPDRTKGIPVSTYVCSFEEPITRVEYQQLLKLGFMSVR
jgi:hypothetical protein